MGRNFPWSYRPPQAPAPDVPKHRSSKNTKRWCKGVQGREHELAWEIWKGNRMCGISSDWQPAMVRVCVKCRKELQMLWPRCGPWDPLARRYQKTFGPAF